ncbi:MAG: putative thiamine transporter permease protein [Ilumatobacteraceae bacterium]|nr:putative thiamine transporter permease protein [Ilumatobacteraceae bacterium]
MTTTVPHTPPQERLGHEPRGNRLPRWVIGALAAPAIVFIGLFYAWPVIALAHRAVTAEAWHEVVHDRSLRRILWFTAWQATLSTAATIVIGLVPAWVLARHEFVGRRWLTALVTVPFVLPTVVVGAAFLALLPRSLDQSVLAILIAHVFFNVAVVVRGVGGLWSELPTDLNAAARTLGAGPWRAMREVTLPLLAPAIEASASVVFLFTFTSFGVVRILGGPAHPTLEVEIWQRATRFGDVGVAAIVSLAQLLVLGIAVAWFTRIQARHRSTIGLRPIENRRRLRHRRERLLVGLCIVAMVAAIAAPLGALVERSTRTSDGGHSLAAWRAVFGGQQATAGRPTAGASLDPLGSLYTSLRFAVIATLISVVIGGCVSLAIAASGRGRRTNRFGRALDTGVMLPLGTSAVTIGFGLIVAFAVAPLDWRAAPLLIPLGHALVATPFVVRVVLPTLRSVDPRLRDAAATLGAPPLRAWREIDVRLMAPALLTGAGFAAAISLGEFGATTFLTRAGRATLPIAIEQLLGRPTAALHAQGYVLATVLAMLTFLVIGAFEALRGLGRRRG